MRSSEKLFVLAVLLAVPAGVRAGFVSYTDEAEWRAAASLVGTGVVHEIDFETLPDGSPSFSGALITDEFNYTDQGVTFFSQNPILQITGNETSGFNLSAGLVGSGGPRNWLIADLVTPAGAIGFHFPGATNISILDEFGLLLATAQYGDTGFNFGGFVSSEPIGTVIIDRGSNVESINSFLFTPVPEPATLILVGTGAICLLRRRP